VVAPAVAVAVPHEANLQHRPKGEKVETHCNHDDPEFDILKCCPVVAGSGRGTRDAFAAAAHVERPSVAQLIQQVRSMIITEEWEMCGLQHPPSPVENRRPWQLHSRTKVVQPTSAGNRGEA